MIFFLLLLLSLNFAQSVGAVEYRLLLCREVRPPPAHKCPGFDKQSDGEIPIMLELWGMYSIPSLLLLPGPHCPRGVASDRVLTIVQIELNVLMLK